jgi:hypothetical protein
MGRAPAMLNEMSCSWEVRDPLCKSRSVPPNYAEAPLGAARTERESYSYLSRYAKE